MGPDRLQNRLNSFNKPLLRVVHYVCVQKDIWMSRVIALFNVVLLFIFVFKHSCNSAAVYINHDYGQPGSEKDSGAEGFLEKRLNSLKLLT